MREEDDHEAASQDEFNQEGKLQIGPFVFNSDIRLTMKRGLRHLYRSYKNRIENLRIENGRLEELIPPEALQVAESYSIESLQQLSLANNKIQSLHFLDKCYFPNLLIINLSRNKLWNLSEIGSHLHFPNLQEVYLHNNHINSIKGIKRWEHPQLMKLTLDLNFITSLQELPQAHLPALRFLLIYSNQISDLRPIFKSFFPKLETLQTYQNQINDLQCTFTILSSKFPSLEAGQLY